MAKYRFALKCWQDRAGDEDAKINVWIDGNQVLTESVVTATSADSPQIVQLGEITGAAVPSSSKSFVIKVELANDLYVDASTDRNVYIDGIGVSYEINESDNYLDGPKDNTDPTPSAITDWSQWNSYGGRMPSAVTSDDIPAYTIDGNFYTIDVLSDAGTTITIPSQVGQYSS